MVEFHFIREFTEEEVERVRELFNRKIKVILDRSFGLCVSISNIDLGNGYFCSVSHNDLRLWHRSDGKDCVFVINNNEPICKASEPSPDMMLAFLYNSADVIDYMNTADVYTEWCEGLMEG